MQTTNEGLIDTWDYQLSFLLLEQNILNIVPVNLLQKILVLQRCYTYQGKRPSYAQKFIKK